MDSVSIPAGRFGVHLSWLSNHVQIRSLKIEHAITMNNDNSHQEEVL